MSITVLPWHDNLYGHIGEFRSFVLAVSSVTHPHASGTLCGILTLNPDRNSPAVGTLAILVAHI